MSVRPRGRAFVALVGVGVAFPVSSFAQALPHRSLDALVSSNGFAPVIFDVATRRVTGFHENLYRFPAPGVQTRDLAYDLYFGIARGGQSRWLTGTPLTEAGYEPGTGLMRFVQRDGDLRLTTHVFAPFDLEARGFVAILQLENLGATPIAGVRAFSLHNFHVGGGSSGFEAESIRWNASAEAFVERSASSTARPGVLVVKAVTPAARHTASPSNPFLLVESNQLFLDVEDSGVLDDAVSGLQFDLAVGQPLEAGGTRYAALAVLWEPGGDEGLAFGALELYLGSRTPPELLEAERRGWLQWFREGRLPRTLTAEESALSLQSLAFLRMGQVREPGAPHGQILAALPPGLWDIAWLRDGLFAAMALLETGHTREAKAFLEFAARGPFGAYESYLGRSYGLSLARYYGNGMEESDSNQNGPNIELDGFGSYLSAVSLLSSGRTEDAWFHANRGRIDAAIADVLGSFRDPATGLVAADSSIWESHWDNGGRQRWAFTSGTAALGLLAWADTISAIAGPSDEAALRHRARGEEISAAIRANLVDPGTGALAASVEQLAGSGGNFADAQTALILHPNDLAASSALGVATLDFLDARLFLGSTTARGYRRNDDGDLYDEAEWIVVDLGISRALRDASRTTEADALVDWITAQANSNFLVIPELFDRDTADYAGAFPMIGFGAGTYVSALVHRGGTVEAFPEPDTDGGLGPVDASDSGSVEAGPSFDGGEDGGLYPVDASSVPDAVGADGGTDAVASRRPAPPQCGCRATPSRARALPLALLALAIVRLRRARPPQLHT